MYLMSLKEFQFPHHAHFKLIPQEFCKFYSQDLISSIKNDIINVVLEMRT